MRTCKRRQWRRHGASRYYKSELLIWPDASQQKWNRGLRRRTNKDNWKNGYRSVNANAHSGRDGGKKANEGKGLQNDVMTRSQHK